MSSNLRVTSLGRLVDALAARGRYHFTTDEAVAATGASVLAVRAALRRLKTKGIVADPHRSFHVIVPPEYRHLGCLPPEQFVPQLMDHLGLTYYASLLTALDYHDRQLRPAQTFYVMTRKNRPELTCGRVRVEFVARTNADLIPTVRIETPRGHIRVSTLEATAFDLIGYGVVRFCIEYFRQLDDHLGFVFLSFSMGQILCAAMIAAGIGLYVYLKRHQNA